MRSPAQVLALFLSYTQTLSDLIQSHSFNTVYTPNIGSHMSLTLRSAGNTPFNSTFAQPTCCLHMGVQQQHKRNLSGG